MKKTLILLVILLSSNLAEAPFIKEKSINAQIGYGLTAPDESVDNVASNGLFAQGEFILKVASWFQLRPYAGFIFTNSNGKDIDGNPTEEFAETKAFLLGGKVRFRAPIRWVAPYFEIGIGTSTGKFKTHTAIVAIDKGGIIHHIPVAFGLELGKNNRIDLGLSYYFQPSVEQFAGALAVGITFPLKN